MTLTNVRTAAQAVQRSFDETAEGLCVSPEYCSVARVTADQSIAASGANIVGMSVSWAAGVATVVLSADGTEIIQFSTPAAGRHCSWVPSVPVRADGDVWVRFSAAGAAAYVYYTELR